MGRNKIRPGYHLRLPTDEPVPFRPRPSDSLSRTRKFRVLAKAGPAWIVEEEDQFLDTGVLYEGALEGIADAAIQTWNEVGIRAPTMLFKAVELNPMQRGQILSVWMDRKHEFVVLDCEMAAIGLEDADLRNLLLHEAMHVEDYLAGRMPSFNVNDDRPYVWFNMLSHFSTEGRLEARGLPHMTREQVAREFKGSFNAVAPTDDVVGAIGDELWGREVSFRDLECLAKHHGLYEDQFSRELPFQYRNLDLPEEHLAQLKQTLASEDFLKEERAGLKRHLDEMPPWEPRK